MDAMQKEVAGRDDHAPIAKVKIGNSRFQEQAKEEMRSGWIRITAEGTSAKRNRRQTARDHVSYQVIQFNADIIHALQGLSTLNFLQDESSIQRYPGAVHVLHIP
jgi:hypothetical protein